MVIAAFAGIFSAWNISFFQAAGARLDFVESQNSHQFGRVISQGFKVVRSPQKAAARWVGLLRSGRWEEAAAQVAKEGSRKLQATADVLDEHLQDLARSQACHFIPGTWVTLLRRRGFRRAGYPARLVIEEAQIVLHKTHQPYLVADLGG